jgi:hypothetical protein
MAKLTHDLLEKKVGTAVSHASAGNLDTILDVAVKV